MTDAERKAMREIQNGLCKAMVEARHSFERFAEAWVRSQNEERRQHELFRLRNRALR